MSVVICLLRGVNLAGHKRIRMEDFRTLLAGLGAKDVRTLLQSGNAVMRVPPRTNLPVLARKVEEAIEARLGFRSDVMLRTEEELRLVVDQCPFSGRELEGSKLTANFLREAPTAAAQQAVLALATGQPEELIFGGRELYIYFVNGIGTSKLPLAKMERALGMTGTTRNWNTVTALLKMASGG